jgi:hypothetical protein
LGLCENDEVVKTFLPDGTDKAQQFFAKVWGWRRNVCGFTGPIIYWQAYIPQTFGARGSSPPTIVTQER